MAVFRTRSEDEPPALIAPAQAAPLVQELRQTPPPPDHPPRH